MDEVPLQKWDLESPLERCAQGSWPHNNAQVDNVVPTLSTFADGSKQGYLPYKKLPPSRTLQ